MILSFTLAPTADANSDADICETDTYQLDGSATNQASVEWTTSGTGTFNDEFALDAIYTPSAADISAGSVTLTLTAYANAPCSDASDDMVLGIYGQPTADAGSDGTVCEDSDYTLAGNATNAPVILWTTSGTGTFDDDSDLNTFYTPSPADITAGNVTITLIAYAVAPCGVDATDDLLLTIQYLPTVNAGADASICQDETYTLSGSANYYFDVAWTTSGDGGFDDPGLLDAEYTPGANDIANGTVTLTLTASSISPCSSDVPDDMILSIQKFAIADAGPDH